MAKQISAIDRANGSWDDYFDTLKKGGQGYVVDYIKNTQDLSKVTGDDLVQANQNARQAAIAHNAALNQQTLGAKAATGALNTLKAVGNAIWWMAILNIITSIISKITDLANAQENAVQKANEAISQFEEQRKALNSNKDTIEEISSDYEKLAKGVDFLGRNVSLNSDEYARYNEIVNKIADMFPQMVQGYTDEGNAIIAHLRVAGDGSISFSILIEEKILKKVLTNQNCGSIMIVI